MMFHVSGASASVSRANLVSWMLVILTSRALQSLGWEAAGNWPGTAKATLKCRMKAYIAVPVAEQEKSYDFNPDWEPGPCVCFGR